MEKRRVRLEINGVVCGLITGESDEYMQRLAREVGQLLNQIQTASPYITREAAALTAALSYCDDATKNALRRGELQERVDELEVEAEIWQEEKEDMLKNGPNPQTKARIQALEQEVTALQAQAGEARELREKLAALEDESEALRLEARRAAQVKELQEQAEALKKENVRLRRAMEPSPEKANLVEELEKLAAENTALKLAVEEKEAQVRKAQQDRQSTVAAAKRAVEEAKRLVDESRARAAQPAPAQQLTLEGAAPSQAPKPRGRRKNPLRHEDEFQQEGLVSFFEKK